MLVNFFVNSQFVWKDLGVTYLPAEFKNVSDIVFDPRF